MRNSIHVRLPGLWCCFAWHLFQSTSTHAVHMACKSNYRLCTFTELTGIAGTPDSVNWHACRLHILVPLHRAGWVLDSSQITNYAGSAMSKASCSGKCCLPSHQVEQCKVLMQATIQHRMDQKGVVGAVRVACRSLSSQGLRRSLEDQASPRHLLMQRRSADASCRRSMHMRQTM